ncbi:DNA primase/ DNA helicase [Caulobacter phage Cr30]|uniref:DNA primase n=1 Tax=Caulobacter phage Cr30 TaxID=1357714 RepID=UPI0004A9BB8B|nr:DNA primase [Caulobacter phage Cr30]AGS80935.1 DNA primase/ DNA helicase [Caulobacter phage Cr30]
MTSSFAQLLIDIKYANLIGVRLERFKLKNNSPYLAQTRCRYCGDSQKSKTKARGYIYQRNNDLKYSCKNCGKGIRFRTFLKEFDEILYKEYVYESFAEKNQTRSKKQEPEEVKEQLPKDTVDKVLASYQKFSELSKDHPGLKLLLKRQLPEFALERLYYIPKFTQFVNSIIPGKLNENFEDEPRILIPFIDKNQRMFGFQGRSFKPNDSMRYITIMLDHDMPKCVNWDLYNRNKRAYVIEGAIDGYFLPNSLATTQGDLRSLDKILGDARRTYVPDKDRRNREILRLIEKLINDNREVCLLPESLPGKDLNEAVCNGFPVEKIQEIVDQNTFSGPRLRLEFARWKRV